MKVLSIGNSFSQDAQRYLHKIAELNGEELKSVNLFIGGCTLKRHFVNMQDGTRSYLFEMNGESTGLNTSLAEAVNSDEWDVITIQQASHESFDIKTYTPYMEKIVEWIKLRQPNAKIYIHQTWAYPDNRERLKEVGFNTTREMFDAVKKTYDEAYNMINADGMIKSGEAMLSAYEMSPETVNRDAIHASYGFGRYLLACVWYKELIGKVPSVHLDKFDEPVSENEMNIIKQIIKK